MQFDAIVVLGEWINRNGSLSNIDKTRVAKGVKLYKEVAASKLICTGCWDMFIPYKPQRTEAEAMKDYAIDLGTPAKNVLIETDALDTIGNAYFVLKKFLKPYELKNIIVVTSCYHKPRTEYVFKNMLGKKYNLKFVETLSKLSRKEYEKKIKNEKITFKIDKWLIRFSRVIGFRTIHFIMFIINQLWIFIKSLSNYKGLSL